MTTLSKDEEELYGFTYSTSVPEMEEEIKRCFTQDFITEAYKSIDPAFIKQKEKRDPNIKSLIEKLKASKIPMSTEYTLVLWPESQNLMEYPWFQECILMNDKSHMPRLGSSAYFVPTNKYKLYKLKQNGEKTEESSE